MNDHDEKDFSDVVAVLTTGYAADPLPRPLKDGVLRKLDEATPRKRRAWTLPLVAAALFVAGMIALVALPGDRLSTPAAQDSEQQRLEHLNREIARLKEEIRVLEEEVARAAKRPPPPAGSSPSKPIRVTAVANEIGLVVISAGKDDGIVEGSKYWVYRDSAFVAQIVIDRIDRKWSAGKVVLKTQEPRVADRVELSQ